MYDVSFQPNHSKFVAVVLLFIILCMPSSTHIQSTAFIETALQMALQSPKVYHLLQNVFAHIENGELKGQQPHKFKGAGLQKALQGKYSAKLLHFKMFQGLKASFYIIYITAQILHHYYKIVCGEI